MKKELSGFSLVAKRLLILVLVICYGQLHAQTIKKDYYDPYYKTKVMAEYQVNSAGQKHGWFKGYDQAGVIVMEYNYSDDQLNGLCKDYTTFSGKRVLAKTETYKNGILNGPAKYYGENNLVIREGEYLNGEKQGVWMFLDPYTNWSLNAEQKKGADYIKSLVNFDKGEIIYPEGEISTYFYPSGKLHSTQTFKNGKKCGKFVYYKPDGTIDSEEFYEDYDAIYKLYTDSALVAFNSGDYASAENYFLKANNSFDAQLMKELSLCQSLQQSGKYKESLTKVINLRKQASNPVIDSLYSIYYVAFIKDLEQKIQPIVSNCDHAGLLKLLEDQGNVFKDEDFERYENLVAELKVKKEERIKAEKEMIASVNKSIADYDATHAVFVSSYVDSNGKTINSYSYPNGKFLYLKSKLVLDNYYKSFLAEIDYDKKMELGNKILTAIQKLNALSKEDCKSFNKQLKSIDDITAIQSLLGI